MGVWGTYGRTRLRNRVTFEKDGCKRTIAETSTRDKDGTVRSPDPRLRVSTHDPDPHSIDRPGTQSWWGTTQGLRRTEGTSPTRKFCRDYRSGGK